MERNYKGIDSTAAQAFMDKLRTPGGKASAETTESNVGKVFEKRARTTFAEGRVDRKPSNIPGTTGK